MEKKLSVKFMSIIFCLLFATSASTTTAFAQESNIKNECKTEIIETVYQRENDTNNQNESTKVEILLTANQVKSMSKAQLISTLDNLTELDSNQIIALANTLKNGNSINAMTATSPTSGQVKEWVIEPYIETRYKTATYTTSWIGIDAYRSSVGMTKGKSDEKTVSVTLGFEGAKEIKAVKSTFKASFTKSFKTVISESQSCPAWTTMNWRPYILSYEDHWYGKQKITSYIPMIGGAVSVQVEYKEYTAIDKSLITESTEVWSRVNSKKDVNAATPLPPQDASSILG